MLEDPVASSVMSQILPNPPKIYRSASSIFLTRKTSSTLSPNDESPSKDSEKTLRTQRTASSIIARKRENARASAQRLSLQNPTSSESSESQSPSANGIIRPIPRRPERPRFYSAKSTPSLNDNTDGNNNRTDEQKQTGQSPPAKAPFRVRPRSLLVDSGSPNEAQTPLFTKRPVKCSTPSETSSTADNGSQHSRSSRSSFLKSGSMDEISAKRKTHEKSSLKVIFDRSSGQFLTPAQAYRQGIIDMNTFNRVRQTRTVNFPRSHSVTSMSSNDSHDSSDSRTKMHIHDPVSNQVLDIDTAYARGIIDQTKYNTLRNQISSQQHMRYTRPKSASAISLATTQTSQTVKKTSQNRSTEFKPWKRAQNPPKNIEGHLSSYQRSASASSVLSQDSRNSEDSQGKMFIRNPKSNALVDLKTALSQDIIDESTYESLRKSEEKGVDQQKTIVVPSQTLVQVEQEDGSQEQMDVSEALARNLISREDYNNFMATIKQKDLSTRVHTLQIR